MPVELTKNELFGIGNPVFTVSQADLIETISDRVVRNMTININVLGLMNSEAFGTLTDVCTANLDEWETSYSLLNGSHVSRRSRPRMATEPAYTFTFKSTLSEAQLLLASDSLTIGLSSFAPASAGAGGAAAGTVVGAVIGSVAGVILIAGVAGGAAVAGRSWIVRRRQRTVQVRYSFPASGSLSF